MSVCVVESKYFKSIIVISVGVGFFCSFILFIFLSSFIFECYLKSVFYFSCDFLLNLLICSAVRHTVAHVWWRWLVTDCIISSVLFFLYWGNFQCCWFCLFVCRGWFVDFHLSCSSNKFTCCSFRLILLKYKWVLVKIDLNFLAKWHSRKSVSNHIFHHCRLTPALFHFM